jgi:hypothetical protein
LALTNTAFRSFFKVGPLALIGIAWAVYENWDRISVFLSELWTKVEPYWNAFKISVQEGISDIMAAWEKVKNFFVTLWNTAQIRLQQFKAVLDEYGVTDKIIAGWNVVKSLFESIWSVAEPYWNKFKLVLQEYAVVDKIMGAWTTVRDFFSTVWSAAAPHWNSFIEKIRSLNISDKIKASWQKLKEFFTGIWDDIAPKWDKFTSSLSKIWGGAKSSVSSIGSLFSSDESKPSIASKLPPLSGAKAAPVTKNQNVTNNITVNASKISDPREVAKQVSKEMSGFNWNFLYDPVGAVP